MFFEYSIAGNARNWFERLEPHSITSFIQLYEKLTIHTSLLLRLLDFGTRLGVSANLMENLFMRPRKRFKTLLRKCPHDAQPKWMQLHIFYDGLTFSNQKQLDAAAWGAFMDISIDDGSILWRRSRGTTIIGSLKEHTTRKKFQSA